MEFGLELVKNRIVRCRYSCLGEDAMKRGFWSEDVGSENIEVETAVTYHSWNQPSGLR